MTKSVSRRDVPGASNERQPLQVGEESFKLRFYVGHDGSMVRLASGLGFGKIAPLRWPALGSEIVMEVNPHSRS